MNYSRKIIKDEKIYEIDLGKGSNFVDNNILEFYHDNNGNYNLYIRFEDYRCTIDIDENDILIYPSNEKIIIDYLTIIPDNFNKSINFIFHDDDKNERINDDNTFGKIIKYSQYDKYGIVFNTQEDYIKYKDEIVKLFRLIEKYKNEDK